LTLKESAIISIESGRYVTKAAMDRLASDEPLSSIPPSELLKPLAIEARPSAEVIELRNAYLKQSAEAEAGQVEASAEEFTPRTERERRLLAELEVLSPEALLERAKQAGFIEDETTLNGRPSAEQAKLIDEMRDVIQRIQQLVEASDGDDAA
jgi:arginine utilization protein RocB